MNKKGNLVGMLKSKFGLPKCMLSFLIGCMKFVFCLSSFLA